MTPTPDTELMACPFKVKDRVQRKHPCSYLFPGVVIAVGLKLDGTTWHCEVECVARGVEGMTHVFPARLLEHRIASTRPADSALRIAMFQTQEMLESIVLLHSTNFREVNERIIANRAALASEEPTVAKGD